MEHFANFCSSFYTPTGYSESIQDTLTPPTRQISTTSKRVIMPGTEVFHDMTDDDQPSRELEELLRDSQRALEDLIEKEEG